MFQVNWTHQMTDFWYCASHAAQQVGSIAGWKERRQTSKHFLETPFSASCPPRLRALAEVGNLPQDKGRSESNTTREGGRWNWPPESHTEYCCFDYQKHQAALTTDRYLCRDGQEPKSDSLFVTQPIFRFFMFLSGTVGRRYPCTEPQRTYGTVRYLRPVLMAAE